jgi:hypothetical protein
VYFTDFTVQRIDTPAEFKAVLQEETSVLTSSVGDINATYAVRAEVDAGGNPYVSGFGLMTDVINGTASSAFGIRSDKFFINNPGNPTDSAFPFVVDVVDGASTVGIRGELIVDGSITTASIGAGVVTAAKITTTSLSAMTANMGVLATGLLTTKGVITGQNPNGSDIYATDTSAFRVELESGVSWPIWYGSGGKNAGNGLFYVTTNGDVVVKGLLDAGMIKQSYFAPPINDSNDSFRIACDYPSNYSGGLYTGKKAHLSPTLTTGYNASAGSAGQYIIASSPTDRAQSNIQLNVGYYTNTIRFYSPTNSSDREYGRLGTLSETLILRYSASLYNEFSDQHHWVILEYRYDAEPWRKAYIAHSTAFRGGRFVQIAAEDVFITRNTAWDTLDFRLGLGAEWIDSITRATVQSVNLTATTANFGYADLSNIIQTTGATTGSTTINRNADITRMYL